MKHVNWQDVRKNVEYIRGAGGMYLNSRGVNIYKYKNGSDARVLRAVRAGTGTTISGTHCAELTADEYDDLDYDAYDDIVELRAAGMYVGLDI